ncbi:MAG: four helix bundle protein [Cyclobacteriaceae bacterium]|nr:four helix bundle protein [Cyclobacteriaceae bacterium]
MKRDPLRIKSYSFAVKIVNISRLLFLEKREYVLGKQLLRSGTSIGAQIMEAEFAQSRSDFQHKMNIALKEANETNYWLCLLRDANLIDPDKFDELSSQCRELIAMLVATTKTLKMRK